MHYQKDGKRTNEEIKHNPNETDPKLLYIEKRKRHDKTITFEDHPLPWKYPKKVTKKAVPTRSLTFSH